MRRSLRARRRQTSFVKSTTRTSFRRTTSSQHSTLLMKTMTSPVTLVTSTWTTRTNRSPQCPAGPHG
eukprot:4358290-Heterocapsa_arctica.AAC.1